MCTQSNEKKEIAWSPAQRAAIDTRADKILVSASAGSGKSTVLTERIISSLLSDERQFDVSRLLVVTFTKESAEDLKLKISEAMRKASDEHPENRRLSEQLIKLPSASISTIHSLCLSIIKNNATTLGLSASVRVGDESEIMAIKADVMNRLLEDAYSGEFAPSENYAEFFDNFVSDRDERLADLFFDIYDKLKNHADGEERWEKAIAVMKNGGFYPDDPFCALLCKNVEIATDYAVTLCTQALEYFKENEAYTVAIEHFEYLRRICAEIHELSVKKAYRAIRDLLSSVEIPELKRLQKGKTPEGEYYRTELNKFIKEKLIKKYKEELFCFTDEAIASLSESGSTLSRSILFLIKEFDRRFTNEKRQRSVLDYSDLEQLSIKALYNDDKSLSSFAYQLSESLDEIYVDEYQDVNPLQNQIFKALSVKASIFMVGDIKQSIYGFRGAMPEIFSEYRRNFKDECEKDKDTSKVFLSTNYRSEQKLLEFSNAVSDGMFRTPEKPCFDYRIPYSLDDRMLYSGDLHDSPDTEILIAKTSKASEDSDEDGVQNRNNTSAEAEMVAKKILELIDSGVSEGDIAILMRSGKRISEFQRVLRAHGISVMTSKGASLFDNPEVQLALCLLNCVDNPYRDIFLSGALKSPMFAFTLDDLISIRRENKECPLFDALTSYVYTHEFPKGNRFLSFFERMKAFAVSNPVDKVLWQIYTETSFFSHIYDEENISKTVVARRRANLLKLHSLACDFTSTGKTDLYSFVERLRKIAESSEPPKGASDEGVGVRIMTMHASKGLEFKYCFVCRTGASLDDRDQNASTIYDCDYGVTAKIKDSIGLSIGDTPYRRALSSKLRLIQRDEEMRNLYVALTRAKYGMFITAEIKDFEKLDVNSRMDAMNPHPMIFLNRSSFISWILTALRMKTDLSPRFKITVMSEDEIFSGANVAVKHEDNPAACDTELDLTLYDTLSKRLSFRYPYARSAELPSKLAVSRLYPGVLDEEDAELVPDYDCIDLPFEAIGDDERHDNSTDLDIPKFIRESETHSGAERGTATHIFMQFCDLTLLEQNGIESEIARLTEKRFILPSMAELVNRAHIKAFLNSELYTEMKKAVYLQREYRFNIKLPASEFTTDDELKEAVKFDYIFVQGVIDCYFRTENGKTVLLDYKTDRLPREIIGKTELEDSFFKERYDKQLSYYKTALERLTGKRVDKVIIYSFVLGRTINL